MSGPSLPAITLHQPWAWAITHAGKRIENRDWPPPLRFGEPLAIHAGRTLDEGDLEGLAADLGLDIEWIRPQIVLGAVVAVCRYAGYITCRPREGGPLPIEQAQWWTGPYGWRLEEVAVLPTPVPCRGYQKIWRLPPEVAAEVAHQWGKAA